MHTPVFIIGYMACGKTTFGRALAKKLGWSFIDLDFYIEQRFRTSIRQIFDSEGESRFREMETAMLHEVGEMCNTVIACGGGTPCFNDNMNYMLGAGTVLFLDTSVERIVERLSHNRSRRPLMASTGNSQLLKAVTEGLAARMSFYSQAHFSHPGTLLETKSQISATVDEVISILNIH